MDKSNISKPTLRRLPVYLNYLKSLPDGALQERYGDPYGDGRIVAVGENRAE